MDRKSKPIASSETTNPFFSNIPKYQYSSSPSTNYIPTTITAAPSPPIPPPHTIDQYPSPNVTNKYEPNYTSNIPIYHNNQHHHSTTQHYQAPSSPLANSPKNQFMFSNITNNRKPINTTLSSSPPPPGAVTSTVPNVYIDRGTSSSGYGNQNVYSNQMYGRTMTQSNHQKLPTTQQQINKDCNDGKHNILNGSSGADAMRGEDQGIIFYKILK